MENNLIYQYFLPYTGDNKDIVGDGGIPNWAKIGIRSAKKYADRINVKYEFCDEKLMAAPNQNLESCRVWMDPYFDQFDKVLLLDVDTIITTDKSIFEIKVEDIGMVQEGGSGCPIGFISKVINTLEDYGKLTFKKSKTYPKQKRYLNGGVQLWSKEGRLKARKLWGGMSEIERYRDTLRMNEQPYINLMINLHDMKITELDSKWNRMSYMWPMGIPDGFINHYLNTDKRKMR